MKLNVDAPLASLFLILMPVVPSLNTSNGLPALVVKGFVEGECRPVVLRVLAHGKVQIHYPYEVLDRAVLSRRMREVYQTRCDRIVFIDHESDVTFGEVAEVIAEVRRAEGHVALLTRSRVGNEGFCPTVRGNSSRD